MVDPGMELFETRIDDVQRDRDVLWDYYLTKVFLNF
jgi:hypothetical protein